MGAWAVCTGGLQAVPAAADVKLRKDWTTAVAGVPPDRHAVYNLDKRMRPIKLRWLVMRRLDRLSMDSSKHPLLHAPLHHSVATALAAPAARRRQATAMAV